MGAILLMIISRSYSILFRYLSSFLACQYILSVIGFYSVCLLPVVVEVSRCFTRWLPVISLLGLLRNWELCSWDLFERRERFVWAEKLVLPGVPPGGCLLIYLVGIESLVRE